jgi:hypothetical protein
MMPSFCTMPMSEMTANHRHQAKSKPTNLSVRMHFAPREPACCGALSAGVGGSAARTRIMVFGPGISGSYPPTTAPSVVQLDQELARAPIQDLPCHVFQHIRRVFQRFDELARRVRSPIHQKRSGRPKGAGVAELITTGGP